MYISRVYTTTLCELVTKWTSRGPAYRRSGAELGIFDIPVYNDMCMCVSIKHHGILDPDRSLRTPVNTQRHNSQFDERGLDWRKLKIVSRNENTSQGKVKNWTQRKVRTTSLLYDVHTYNFYACWSSVVYRTHASKKVVSDLFFLL